MSASEETLVHPDVQRVWNAAAAGGSDKSYPSLDLVRLEKWHFGGTGRGRMLEYACGSGTNLIHLLKCGYEVDAMDAAPAMIDLVRRKLQPLSDLSPRAHLHVVDATSRQLPFEDATFDFINCMNVLSLLASRSRVMLLLGEFRRIMKPGAKIILDINGPHADFAVRATALGGDVYLYNDTAPGQVSVPTYCPPNAKVFADLVAEYFALDDVGFSHHRYYGSEIEEFIVCAHKA